MDTIKDRVRQEYAAAARRVRDGEGTACRCDTGCCSGDATAVGYDAVDVASLPVDALIASLGCGNPAQLAGLKPGESVLDLGSGGGIDVLLSAKRVGPTGKAYGLDMTDDMVALARANQEKAGLINVEFLHGDIENIPLPASTVDVVISNCVINLAVDKDRVLAEAFRVLKPGGRIAVSDIVRVNGAVTLPDPRRWVSCIDGALEEQAYREKLLRAGFTDIEITRTAPEREGAYVSAFVKASKPVPGAHACCETGCCGGSS
jgi:SAM-dependent methyltransferase